MQIDGIKAKGIVSFDLTHEDGSVEHFESENMVVTAGLGVITNRLSGLGGTAMTHMGVGSSSTAAATAQTDLQTAVGARVGLSSTTRVTTTVTNDAVQYAATFGPGVSTGTLVEAGLFDAVSAGSMLARTVFGAITKAAGDSLTITWKITFS